MKTLSIDLGRDSYDIQIGAGLIQEAGSLIKKVYQGRRVIIVADGNLWPIQGEPLRRSLEKAGFETELLFTTPGEEGKSLESYGKLCEDLSKAHTLRSELILAFGGGVTGDVAGFAAATYMRGIPYVQIPTSLLAQVDSSVGGKTAINLRQGKNLVGAFYQPKMVIADTQLLETLPNREFACGMAEIIKYGVIRRPILLYQLREWAGRDRASGHMEEIVSACCEIKAAIVAKDQFDTGLRRILNFGHTIGHAVEKAGDGKYNHGEAIAMGMIIAAKIGIKLGFSSKELLELLDELFQAYALPNRCELDSETLMPYILLDKKRTKATVPLVLIQEIGQTIVEELEISDLEKLLEGELNEPS